MLLDDVLNKAGNGLNDVLLSIDKSLHTKIKDTAIDNFIHELSNYLDRADAINNLKN